MHSVRALQATLASYGIERSRSAVFRMIDRPPHTISLPLLAALCCIFDCTPNDLLTLTTQDDMLPFPDPPQLVFYKRRRK